jgi:ubiquinone/menaquinone biosynthesis C-methylase UbiE
VYPFQEHSVTRRSYDRISRWYDWLSSSERAYINLCLEMLSPQAGEKVLEIGCGTGYALGKLERIVRNPGDIVGVDLSLGMLQVARRKANIAFTICGDALRTPFPDSAFDLILMSFTLELFPDDEIAPVLAECRRLLHPEGKLGIVGLAKKTGDGSMVRLYEWAHRRFPKLVDCRPIELQMWVERAGFGIREKAEWKMWGLDVDGIVAIKNDIAARTIK